MTPFFQFSGSCEILVSVKEEPRSELSPSADKLLTVFKQEPKDPTEDITEEVSLLEETDDLTSVNVDCVEEEVETQNSATCVEKGSSGEPEKPIKGKPSGQGTFINKHELLGKTVDEEPDTPTIFSVKSSEKTTNTSSSSSSLLVTLDNPTIHYGRPWLGPVQPLGRSSRARAVHERKKTSVVKLRPKKTSVVKLRPKKTSVVRSQPLLQSHVNAMESQRKSLLKTSVICPESKGQREPQTLAISADADDGFDVKELDVDGYDFDVKERDVDGDEFDVKERDVDGDDFDVKERDVDGDDFDVKQGDVGKAEFDVKDIFRKDVIISCGICGHECHKEDMKKHLKTHELDDDCNNTDSVTFDGVAQLESVDQVLEPPERDPFKKCNLCGMSIAVTDFAFHMNRHNCMADESNLDHLYCKLNHDERMEYVRQNAGGSGLPQTIYKCSKCKYMSSNILNIREHVQSCYMRDDPRYGCPSCGCLFKYKRTLNCHMTRYGHGISSLPSAQASLRFFSCNVCPYVTTSKNMYVKHSKACNKTSIHKCKICDKTFEQRHSLTDHLKTHISQDHWYSLQESCK